MSKQTKKLDPIKKRCGDNLDLTSSHQSRFKVQILPDMTQLGG